MEPIKYGVANTVYFKLVDSNGDYVTGATFEAGDIQVSIDGGAYANVTNSVTEEGRGTYSLVLTIAESTGEKIIVDVIDQTDPKAFLDNGLKLYTIGSGNGFIDQDDYKADVSALPTLAEILAGLNAGTYDGATFTALMEGLRGLIDGNVSVSGVGTGTRTVTMYKNDGTTPIASFTVSETTTARTIV